MESADFSENYPITIQNLKRIYGTKVLGMLPVTHSEF
jgi:hypothetical protein